MCRHTFVPGEGAQRWCSRVVCVVSELISRWISLKPLGVHYFYRMPNEFLAAAELPSLFPSLFG